jgi:antitoxin HigA-1
MIRSFKHKGLQLFYENGHVYVLNYEDHHQMNMHNPPHPSEFIKEIYLEPFNFTFNENELAQKLKITPQVFLKFMNAETNISPDMALRLSKVLGRSPESWLLMNLKP